MKAIKIILVLAVLMFPVFASASEYFVYMDKQLIAGNVSEITLENSTVRFTKNDEQFIIRRENFPYTEIMSYDKVIGVMNNSFYELKENVWKKMKEKSLK